ncbi:hypothetical protein KA005_12160 [bacterium]|nr:hypothetical protein [bacterium]
MGTDLQVVFTAYMQDEEFVQSNKLGIWSKEFLIPSEWYKSDKGVGYERK